MTELAQLCDNLSETGRRVNVTRSLTHSLDYGEERLAMQATRRGCTPENCTEKQFQELALRTFVVFRDNISILPWTWVSNSCGTEHCLTLKHMTMVAPLRILYPQLLCIYCGRPGGTKDHLLPVGMTGFAQRRQVATVPACAMCNSAINDLPDYRIGARREHAHAFLRRYYRRDMEPSVPYTEFEGRLRQYVKGAKVKRDRALALLAWPDDPMFDLRAFQKTGIEDPYAMGLI